MEAHDTPWKPAEAYGNPYNYMETYRTMGNIVKAHGRDEHKYLNTEIVNYVGPQINNRNWIITLLLFKYIQIFA